MLSYILVGVFLVCNVFAFPDINTKIVGGEDTIIDLQPYQAALQFHRGPTIFHHCGGSIISSRFILTAAHCEPGTWAEMFFARVGSTYYNSGGQVLKIESFIQHPQFDRSNLDYDYAIVGFSEGQVIELSPSVLVALLAEENSPDPADGSLVMVSGWGYVDEIHQDSITLRKVSLPVFNAEACKAITVSWTPRHLCLGGTAQGYLSACYGDSGSPAMQNGTQQALVSGGTSCFAPGIPGLYSKISAARPWIDSIVSRKH